MTRVLLLIIAVLWLTTGLVIFSAPRTFYDLTPGLSLMGPYSVHFICDVGLAFVASGAVTVAGASLHGRELALAGVSWPFLHALLHVQIWGHRGFPFDRIAGFDVVAVILPALFAAALAWQLRTPGLSVRREAAQ